MIPDYYTVVIDEGHAVVARVTQAATDELAVSDVERAARRAARDVEESEADDLDDGAGALKDAIGRTEAGRMDKMDPQLADALILVRDGARAALGAIPKEKDGEADPGRNQAKAGVQEVFATADRMAEIGRAHV